MLANPGKRCIKEPVTLVYGASAHRGEFCQYPGGADPCPGRNMALPKYGEQFQVIKYQETKPATLTGIEKYLGNALIKGVGSLTPRIWSNASWIPSSLPIDFVTRPIALKLLENRYLVF